LIVGCSGRAELARLRLGSATQNASTVIRASNSDSGGTSWAAVLATFADSTNTVKGHIRLFKTADPTKWLVFTVWAVASPTGYKNITVASVGSSAASPFANGDAITLAFELAGDVGATGPAGPSGPTGVIPVYNATGTLQTDQHVVTGTTAATSGGGLTVTVTFSGSAAFTNASSFICTATAT
jgi:hypothetical protein